MNGYDAEALHKLYLRVVKLEMRDKAIMATLNGMRERLDRIQELALENKKLREV